MLHQSYFHTMKFNLGDYDLGYLGLDFSLADFDLGDFDLIPRLVTCIAVVCIHLKHNLRASSTQN